ncbi:hypothetical protein [Bradyrhizobium sp. 76]|uniref:hypothetical protein n=1 Tax=Bradyrhizobium sp. 76 TaxID=2782680 RepID=UPI001FF9FBF8|nr:hypothetical protein [Bradyrhizobium sp. 76]MCK1406203.1 hypothetical protein [Bradyrhizobium sp. 76]
MPMVSGDLQSITMARAAAVSPAIARRHSGIVVVVPCTKAVTSALKASSNSSAGAVAAGWIVPFVVVVVLQVDLHRSRSQLRVRCD